MNRLSNNQILNLFLEIDPWTKSQKYTKKEFFRLEEFREAITQQTNIKIFRRKINPNTKLGINLVFWYNRVSHGSRGMDLDNMVKAVIDAIQNFLIYNDYSIYDIRARKEETKLVKGISLTLHKIE